MNKTHALIIGAAVLFAAVAYAVSSGQDEPYDIATAPSVQPTGQPMQKVAPAATQDGEYYVTVKEVTSNGEDTVLTMSHVTYFEGEEARLSARQSENCGETPLEECVPTLAQGYYVRQSGAPDFTAPLTASTKIELSGKGTVSLPDLAMYVKAASNRPVFVVAMKDGQVARIRQVR